LGASPGVYNGVLTAVVVAWVACTLFAVLAANYWIVDEIYPSVR
jgi:hypothetical protein